MQKENKNNPKTRMEETTLKTGCLWEDNIKIDIKEIGSEHVPRTELAQGIVQ
jgi:hypothetical protein